MQSLLLAMLLALLPALVSIALFVGTLRLRPSARRATLLPPAPAARKA